MRWRPFWQRARSWAGVQEKTSSCEMWNKAAADWRMKCKAGREHRIILITFLIMYLKWQELWLFQRHKTAIQLHSPLSDVCLVISSILSAPSCQTHICNQINRKWAHTHTITQSVDGKLLHEYKWSYKIGTDMSSYVIKWLF